ncbi:Rho-type gtpase-activating protein [Tritrichomonas musculus]|uniref:Rho-type gtpase-activating protein n=1 Tax=Tritrichomonas musculus TaxID=1915356 RepID=A0ABR2IJR2_9EUKA
MSSQGFFHQPLEFYHGRIPFIVVDLIKRLRELDAESSADILNEDNVGNNIDQIINELDMRPIKNWKNYKNVSTLSIVLVRYLNSITFDEPLFTNPCKDALIEANLTLKSPNYAHIFRKNLMNLYPGNYRTILAVTDFLRNVETTSLDVMFEQFGPSFFGKNAIQRNRTQFRVLFILLLIHHSEIFKGAILGPAAYLTPQQIAVLERRLVEKSSSNNSSAERDAALATPRSAVAPHTPKSPSSSYNHKSQTKTENIQKQKPKTREINIKGQFHSSDEEDYYEEESREETQPTQEYSETYSEVYSTHNNYEEEDAYSDEIINKKVSKKKVNNTSKSNSSKKSQSNSLKKSQSNSLKKSQSNSSKKSQSNVKKNNSKDYSNKKSTKSSNINKHSHKRNQEQEEEELESIHERGINLDFHDENHQEKVFTHLNVIVADIQPNNAYAEASAQAACLTMTSVKAIFSNDAPSKKKSAKKTIKIARRKSKMTENDNSDEKEEYSDYGNNEINVDLDIINERKDNYSNNGKNSSDNTNNDNDYDYDTNDININSNFGDSTLASSESYLRKAIDKIKIDEKNQENLNQFHNHEVDESDTSNIFNTD